MGVENLQRKLGAMLLPPNNYCRTSYYVDLIVNGKRETEKFDSYKKALNEANNLDRFIRSDCRYDSYDIEIIVYSKDYNKSNRCIRTNILNRVR